MERNLKSKSPLNKLKYRKYLLYEFSLSLRITRGRKLYFVKLDVVDIKLPEWKEICKNIVFDKSKCNYHNLNLLYL